MSLVEHLSELRRRIAISAIAIGAASAIGFYLAPQVITILKAPIPGPLQFLTVGGAFFLQVRVAVIMGIGFAMPLVLYQVWAFVAPGLTPQERRVARPWIPLSAVFFLLGLGVAYLILPYTVGFLRSFEIPGVLEEGITAENYFGFITTMFLAFGVIMQFPTVLVLLNRLGILTLDRLRSSRRYVLLGIVIVSVVITPGGDPVSPMIMSIVMYALYEVTIIMLRRSGR